MKQILQNLSDGATAVTEVPCPALGSGQVLIRSRASVISVGTERMLVAFGRANLIDKARQQPDKVRQVLAKVKTDGILPTLKAVRARFDEPLPLGYSNAGVVLQVGPGVKEFQVGDRVISNGAHAEVVAVQQNLCAKIPAGPCAISDEEAAFVVLAAIALQGIRLAEPSLGETFVVSGLGLIGLLAVQLLTAHGCKVIGLDFDAARLGLARQFGAETIDLSRCENPVATALTLTQGRGVDGVIIAASTTSSDPVHQGAQMCRKRGRIVLVGVTGLQLSRADFYEKELSFQVSCSYGPGRYDSDYEQDGHDYPLGFVRWTEKRNFEAVLDLLAHGRLSIAPLISHRFSFAQAEMAYGLLGHGALGIVLNYADEIERPTSHLLDRTVRVPQAARTVSEPRVAIIGAGGYTKQILLPVLKQAGARLGTIASKAGISSAHAGRKFGFEAITTDVGAIFNDPAIDGIVITTRHDTHAALLQQALKAGKHAFVEKPLAVTPSELHGLSATYRGLNHPPVVAVGFNRRFAPLARRMRELLAHVAEPKTFIMTVNAGEIPLDHWTQDRQVGGGRIVGEACHFIDLLRYLVGHRIVSLHATMLGGTASPASREDKMTLTLSFADGSHGTVHYFANGHKSFPKERLEVFAGGRILALDNFKSLTGYGWRSFHRLALWTQDKGHASCIEAFLDAIKKGGPPPIPFEEIVEVSQACFDAIKLVTAVGAEET